MKKADINRAVATACAKFDVDPPKRSDIVLDKKTNVARFTVPSATPVVFLNSLGRSIGVQPKNIRVSGLGGIVEVELDFAA